MTFIRMFIWKNPNPGSSLLGLPGPEKLISLETIFFNLPVVLSGSADDLQD